MAKQRTNHRRSLFVTLTTTSRSLCNPPRDIGTIGLTLHWIISFWLLSLFTPWVTSRLLCRRNVRQVKIRLSSIPSVSLYNNDDDDDDDDEGDIPFFLNLGGNSALVEKPKKKGYFCTSRCDVLLMRTNFAQQSWIEKMVAMAVRTALDLTIFTVVYLPTFYIVKASVVLLLGSLDGYTHRVG